MTSGDSTQERALCFAPHSRYSPCSSTAGASPAGVVTKTVEYEYDGTKLKGFLAYDDAAKDKRPGVLVVHEWWGLNDYAKERCQEAGRTRLRRVRLRHVRRGQATEHPEEARKMATRSART